jgi:hypothetical protein
MLAVAPKALLDPLLVIEVEALESNPESRGEEEIGLGRNLEVEYTLK